MNDIVTPQSEVLYDLMKALGLPDHVCGFSLNVHGPDELPSIIVEYYPTKDAWQPIKEIRHIFSKSEWELP